MTAVAESNKPKTARARVREELTREIKDVARRQLAESGSAALSLRAVARELGMVSSAVYRYFPSRDELLTALIVEAYEAVAESCATAEAAVDRTRFADRWLAAAGGVRSWALANPQEYALIFGSPVPGYQAPQDTIDPAARIPLLLLAIVTEAAAAGYAPQADETPIPKPVRSDLRALRELLSSPLPARLLARSLMAWTQLIGSISFELFGHLKGSVVDYDAYFDYQMTQVGRDLGLVAPVS